MPRTLRHEWGTSTAHTTTRSSPLDHPQFPTHRKERDEWATPANSLIQKKHDTEQTEALPDLRSASLHDLHLLPPAPLPRNVHARIVLQDELAPEKRLS